MPGAIDASSCNHALLALDLPAAARHACWVSLDATERARATRYRQPRDRDRFVARHGLLRRHLAQMLDLAAVRIDVDRHGKPFLPDAPDLQFNLSHSNGLALVVTAWGRAVGCDIEWCNPALACPRVAERLFAPEERAALAALPAEQRVAGFFDCWTRKEAYVKALGLGLSHPLDAFAVSLAPGEPACFTRAEPGWTLTAFAPAPGFHAAVVTRA